jgi:uncharacterized membrane protein YoaK (UPF0700 family)
MTDQKNALPALLLALTVTTGMVDAVSVLGLGHVFTAIVTGNVVFLGLSLAGVPGYSPWRSLAAIAAFILGAAAGGRLGFALDRSRRRWLMTVAAIESAIFFAAAILAIGYDAEALTPESRLYLLIGMVAFAMGIHNATARRLAVPDLLTSVLTLTLTGLGADSTLAGGTNPRFARRLMSIAATLIGAFVGAALTRSVGIAWPLAIIGAITLTATGAYAMHPESLKSV